jgi:purine-binding chemotaxis protein CheW
MSQQYLTFKLAGEEYGVGILSVQEIRGWSGVTAMPNAPAWLLGLLDLRGVAVPVIDLRRRFALAPAEFGPTTVIIVLRVSAGNEERTVGLLVDAISEVYDIESSAFRNLPDFGSSATSEMVNGLAHTDGKTVILLDAHRLATNAMVA